MYVGSIHPSSCQEHESLISVSCIVPRYIDVDSDPHRAYATLRGWGWRRRADGGARAKMGEGLGLFGGGRFLCKARYVGRLS